MYKRTITIVDHQDNEKFIFIINSASFLKRIFGKSLCYKGI